MSHYKPDPNKTVSLTINGRPVTVPEGTRILEAAKMAGVHIPTLCDHPDLHRRSVCRLCVVECDGRGKLLAACANDAAEGMSVVTHNARIVNIRKAILELILSNHPQECIFCIRNKNCELQKLAADFGIRESPFRPYDTDRRSLSRIPALVENEVLVRDMQKCVKCGRCVEVCQESEAIRAINSSHRGIHYEITAPYARALSDGPCTFCGHCVEVCPVGALHEYEQTAEVWAALGNKNRTAAVQIAPSLCEALGTELGSDAETINPGKMASALKLLGFESVFDARYPASLAAEETGAELLNRIKGGGQPAKSKRLPLITGCTPGWINFAKAWPGLSDHFFTSTSPRSIFARKVRDLYSREDINPPVTSAVTITPCIAGKFETPKAKPENAPVLTVRELARMIRLAGIEITGLQEKPFDLFEDETPNDKIAVQGNNPQMPLRKGITETELVLRGTTVKALIVSGFANARTVLDSVSRGECNADFVEIISCSGEGSHAHCPIYTNFPTNVLK